MEEDMQGIFVEYDTVNGKQVIINSKEFYREKATIEDKDGNK
jgi:hypothetical protein